MEIFLGAILFIMGTFFGSFFTLAVYRIPLKKDITHERSFCPTCDHKLGALDLVPVWSYVFLRGKCRYCGEKIRIRYFLLEILSGSVFLVMYLILNRHGDFFTMNILEFAISFVFQYVTIVLVAGIDKEYRTINSSVLLFGFLCQMVYTVYLYVVRNVNIYRYIIYAILFVLVFLLNWKISKNYFVQIMLLISYILLAVGMIAIPFIGIFSIIILGILKWLGMRKSKYQTWQQMPVGFAIGISTIVYKIVESFTLQF